MYIRLGLLLLLWPLAYGCGHRASTVADRLQERGASAPEAVAAIQQAEATAHRSARALAREIESVKLAVRQIDIPPMPISPVVVEPAYRAPAPVLDRSGVVIDKIDKALDVIRATSNDHAALIEQLFLLSAERSDKAEAALARVEQGLTDYRTAQADAAQLRELTNGGIGGGLALIFGFLLARLKRTWKERGFA